MADIEELIDKTMGWMTTIERDENRTALLTAFNAQVTKIAELEADSRGDKRIVNAALARIAELEAAQRWIPVEERLPPIIQKEEGHQASATVLVPWPNYCDDEKSDHFGEEWITIEKAWTIDDIWMNWEGYERKIGSEEAPTHWMPLPLSPPPSPAVV
jgi:hypothetical protein